MKIKTYQCLCDVAKLVIRGNLHIELPIFKKRKIFKSKNLPLKHKE